MQKAQAWRRGTQQEFPAQESFLEEVALRLRPRSLGKYSTACAQVWRSERAWKLPEAEESQSGWRTECERESDEKHSRKGHWTGPHKETEAFVTSFLPFAACGDVLLLSPFYRCADWEPGGGLPEDLTQSPDSSVCGLRLERLGAAGAWLHPEGSGQWAVSGWPPEAGSPSLGMDAWPEPAPACSLASAAAAAASASPTQAAARRCTAAVPLWGGPALLSRPAEPRLHTGDKPLPTTIAVPEERPPSTGVSPGSCLSSLPFSVARRPFGGTAGCEGDLRPPLGGLAEQRLD